MSDDLFSRLLPLIDRVIRSVCRRKCLSADEADDFAQEVRLKLWENDCARLRQFDGRSEMKTYLTTVVTRLWYDSQREKPGGRWRASAAAKRLGPVAEALERLLFRDGIAFEEAAELLRRNHGVTMSIEELAELAGKLPPRSRPRFDGEEILELLVATNPPADKALVDREQEERTSKLLAALQNLLMALSAEDRLLLELRYEDGLPVSQIEHILGIRQRLLYSRCEKLLRALRKALKRLSD